MGCGIGGEGYGECDDWGEEEEEKEGECDVHDGGKDRCFCEDVWLAGSSGSWENMSFIDEDFNLSFEASRKLHRLSCTMWCD